MSKPAYDPIAPWFISAEELGEFIGIRFGRIPPGKSEPEWIFLRHIDFDGIGGLAEILRKRGAELGRLPQIKHPVSPSSFSLLKFLPKYLKPRRRLEWDKLKGEKRPSTVSEPPAAVGWHVFSESETMQIRRVCRKAGVTVNSFLLKHLTKAIRPFLKDQSALVPWMIPVNLRGKVAGQRDTANFSSYVSVKVKSYETVQDVHKNIYAALESGEHWANWGAYQLGRFTTNGIRKHMISTDKAMSQWNIGSFSNLGDWDPEKTITQPDCLGAWVFTPPVLRGQLLGAGCVTFQNRLTVTIQVHPELTTASQVPKTWVDDWVKEIGIDLASFLSTPFARE